MPSSVQIRLFFFLFGLVILIGCAEKKPSQENNREITQKDSSESSSILRIKAGAFYSKNQFEEASKVYAKLIALDSMDSVAIYRYGFCNAQLGRDSVAIKYFQKSEQLNYRVFDTNYSLGVIYLSQGDNQKAAFYFKKCLELDGNDKEVQHFLDLINKGKSNL